jgi:hypothetical protein
MAIYRGEMRGFVDLLMDGLGHMFDCDGVLVLPMKDRVR